LVPGREFKLPFFRGFYGAQAFGASASHDISHMHRRYSALSQRPKELEKRESGNEVGGEAAVKIDHVIMQCTINKKTDAQSKN